MKALSFLPCLLAWTHPRTLGLPASSGKLASFCVLTNPLAVCWEFFILVFSRPGDGILEKRNIGRYLDL